LFFYFAIVLSLPCDFVWPQGEKQYIAHKISAAARYWVSGLGNPLLAFTHKLSCEMKQLRTNTWTPTAGPSVLCLYTQPSACTHGELQCV